MRLMNQGNGKKISLPEMNARINELLKASIKSEGVINLFSDVSQNFSTSFSRSTNFKSVGTLLYILVYLHSILCTLRASKRTRFGSFFFM